MRIALVSHSSEHIDRGGPTTRILGLADRFERQGHTVQTFHNLDTRIPSESFDIAHVFNSWPITGAIDQLKTSRAMAKRVVFSPIALNLMHKPFAEQGILSILEQAKSVDQVQSSLAAMKSIVPAKSACPSSGWPLYEGAPGHFDGLKSATALADHVITLSEYEQSFLKSIRAPMAASSLVYNGARRFHCNESVAASFKNQFGLEKFILTVGRIESRKNQAAVAIAANKLNLPLVCIGAAHQSEYLQQVRNWGGESLVHIPHTEQADLLAGAYAAASVFCLPSWSEGAPIAALEAHHAGTPLVLSSLSGEREYFQSNARYVHPCDIDEMMSAIQASMHPTQPRSYDALDAQMADRTSVQSHADQTLRVYQAVLNSPSHSKDRSRRIAPAPQESPVSGAPAATASREFTHERIAVEVWLTRQNRKYSFLNLAALLRNNSALEVAYVLSKRYVFRLKELWRSVARRSGSSAWIERSTPVRHKPSWLRRTFTKAGLVIQVYERPSQPVQR